MYCYVSSFNPKHDKACGKYLFNHFNYDFLVYDFPGAEIEKYLVKKASKGQNSVKLSKLINDLYLQKYDIYNTKQL